VVVPGSKSHTIRALVIAALADGESTVRAPLDSEDTRSCVGALRALGVEIREESRAGRPAAFVVTGTGGRFSQPTAPLDCGNSGTSFYILLSVAALADFPVVFTGDEQLQKRSAEPLLAALESLGARVERHGNGGRPPVTITGPIRGGTADMACKTSQYLTSLLLSAPLASAPTEITIPLLNERPYVEMTLSWLDSQDVKVSQDGWSWFGIPGSRQYHGFDRTIPGDFSAATFFACAAAASGSRLQISPLDMNDSQGDRAVFACLRDLGCTVSHDEQSVTISGPDREMQGGSVDLNTMPDALPAMAVFGTRTNELRLVNVAHAREKETDRIEVMATELAKLGASVEQRTDGLEIRRSTLSGGTVCSHGDHRVAMALSIAGLIAEGPVTVEDSACVSVTFPDFFDQLRAAGGRVEIS